MNIYIYIYIYIYSDNLKIKPILIGINIFHTPDQIRPQARY